MKVLIRVSGTERLENKEAIFRFLEVVRRGVIQDQDAKGIRSSGKSAASLGIQEISKGGQLVGDDYFQQQITGRRPGKFPPIKPILDWIEEKGISPEGISKKSLAFLIARKIAKKGTDIYSGLRPGLSVAEVAETYEPALRDSFVKAGRIAINTAIFGALNQKPTGIRA